MPTAQQHIDALFAALDSGAEMQDILRGYEREAGRRIVLPGDEPWLPAEDWDPTITVSVDGTKVRLVAILAKRPGTGAFRRLISGIEQAGLTPCMVDPIRSMQETLTRWGWKPRRYGYGIECETQWTPRRRSGA
jgi:hypothetical protein